MDARMRNGLVVLTCLALNGCAIGTKPGRTADRAVPGDVIQASCDKAVRTLHGQPDHNIAMRACVDAKTWQGVD
jgi:hypothetical protein